MDGKKNYSKMSKKQKETRSEKQKVQQSVSNEKGFEQKSNTRRYVNGDTKGKPNVQMYRFVYTVLSQ